MIGRVSYLNKPYSRVGLVNLHKAVNHFIFQEKALELRYQIYYVDGDGPRLPEAIIKVYKEDADNLTGPWTLFGEYNAVQWKKFSVDLSRSTLENPTGAVELANNLLYNGLFNAIPDPIDGWTILTDGTTGTAFMRGEGNRLVFGSDGTGSMVIRNTKSVFTNLVSYAVSMRIHAVTGTAQFITQIGGQNGATRSVVGVFNETIISGGVEFDLDITLTTPDAEIIIDYFIVNGN